jgi:aspartate/methionine/tyrosine aminotransferase
MDQHQLKFSARGDALIGQEMFKVLERARKIEEAGGTVIHLELGNPRLPPPPGLVEATIETLKRYDVGYTYSGGLPVLRQTIAKRYRDAHHCAVTEANVVVSPANFLINQFLDLCCDRGDSVVFFTPAFPTYWAAAAHIGLRVEEVALGAERGYDLTRADVDAAVAKRPRAILVNSANNPTGAVYSREVLEYLSDRCGEAGIWILSDETYGDIAYGRPFYTMAEPSARHVVVMCSFSKIFSVPGYRLGFAVAAPDVIAKLSLSVSTQLSCLPIFTQLGCVEGLKVIDEYTGALRERFARTNSECAEIINETNILRCAAPAAGFYVFVDLAGLDIDDMTFCQRLLDECSVAVTPGRSFGPAYKHHIRIATCGEWPSVREGVVRTIALSRRLAGATAA